MKETPDQIRPDNEEQYALLNRLSDLFRQQFGSDIPKEISAKLQKLPIQKLQNIEELVLTEIRWLWESKDALSKKMLALFADTLENFNPTA